MRKESVVVQNEREIVRSLARRVAEIAASPENVRICQRWRDVNALRKPDRAPVYCRPVGCWQELLPPSALRCQDPWLRSLEQGFRMTLIKHEIGDDTPVEGEFGVAAVFTCDPPNVWGVDVRHVSSDVPGGSWAYDPPLKSEADFDRLRLPTYIYDEAQTKRRLEQAHDLLGDILPVKLTCGPPLGATLCTYAGHLRGLGTLLMDMAAQPSLVHRLMAHLRDGVLQAMQQVASTGLLSSNNHGPMTCSDPIGDPTPGKPLTYKNLWGTANSQEFDPVSPAMWREFLLEYQRPILEQFGLTQYGCCENLTHKIDGVLSLSNLRVFVCSAWTDLDKVIERVGNRYTIMWRQKASDVVFPNDTTTIARHLDEGLRKLKGCYVQIVLRELQTLAGHPDRLHVWTRLAIEAAERHA